ncbi:MAG TPA: transglutaminase family protein [Candidatus Synoicihabitans sp.]|nr:transglutaminase family protein [Candidatus Synoicihabitans sp.]
MRYSVSTRLAYTVAAPTTFLLNVQALSGLGQFAEHESLRINPQPEVEEFPAEGGRARLLRFRAEPTNALEILYEAQICARTATVAWADLTHSGVAANPPDVLPYLFPSRYCQSDRLGRLAWQTFGHLPTAVEQITAICDWIHDNVTYLRGSTHASTSAADTLLERAGVCRDFAHLGIALCRALNLPARYVSGYACGMEPPDLHAWFEVAIGGRWVVFDATRLAPFNGLVRIGYGRDAADVSLATLFGPAAFQSLVVSCAPAPGESFEPWPRGQHPTLAVVAGPASDAAVEDAA